MTRIAPALVGASPSQGTLWGYGETSVAPVTGRWQALDGASAIYHQPYWLQGADAAFDEVERACAWRSMRRPMYDRIVDVPRLIANPARGALPSPALVRIVEGVEELLGIRADHVGLNLYRTGADSVTWHRDRIGRQRDWSAIALVSLGGPRTFSLRPWAPGNAVGSTRHLRLESGDLLVMAGACQRDWEHAVLKTATAAPRISVGIRSRQFPQGPLFEQAGVPSFRSSRNLQ
ncbi:MAG: alpha-ketoglutarate-dependent dioxygenase AlkB [Actinomycetota bacterium]